jgi:hypothetical protein
MSNGNIIGTVIDVAERGEWRTVIIQREASDEYERKNPEKTIIPMDMSPYIYKRTGVSGLLRVGTLVAVTFRLTGREYNGKRYLSACIDSIESAGGEADDAPGAVRTDPTGAAPDGKREEDPLPF